MKFAHLITFLPLAQALPLAKRDGTELVIRNRLGNYYEIEGTVGDYFTNLSFVINSGQDDSWVSSDQFNTNLSNTFTSSTEEFCFQDFVTGMTVSGVYGSDTVSFESQDIDSLKFGVATTNQAGYSASLGLGSSSSFIEALYNAGKITSRIVSIWLQNNRSPGKINFGGTDSSLYSGSLTYVDLIGYETDKTNGGYFVSLDAIETSSGSKLASEQTGYIDTASVLSYVPSEVLRQITDDLQASVDQTSGLWTVDCGTIETTDLRYKLVFGSTEIEVQANQLFFQESSTCYLTVTETQIDGVVVLGQSFLTSIYLVFDLDKQQVGLAQVDVDKNVVTSCSLCSHSSTSSSSSSSLTTPSTSSASSTTSSISTTTSSSSMSTTSSSSSFSTSYNSTYSSSSLTSSTSLSSSTLTSRTSTSDTSSSTVPKTSSSRFSSTSISTTPISSVSSSTSRSFSHSTSTTPALTSSSTSSYWSTATPSSSSSTQLCSGSLVTTTYSTTISSGDWTTISVMTSYICSFAVSSFETTTQTTCTICTSTTPSPEVSTVSSHESSATPHSTVTSSTSKDLSSFLTLLTPSTTPLQVTTVSSSSSLSISSSSSSSMPESHSSTLASTWITSSSPGTPPKYETTVHTENTVTDTLSCSTETAPESSAFESSVTSTSSSQAPSSSTPTPSEVTSATLATQSTQTVTEDCSCYTSVYVSSGTTIFTVVSTRTSTYPGIVISSTSSSLQSLTKSQTPRQSSLADFSLVSSSSTSSAHSVLTFAGAGVRNQLSLAAVLPVLFYVL
ncbi:hypothetical protein KL910_003208 [Ogataea haglerorum]|nr:hypothetical protein KL945_002629 [Ogataea haglerorum]KAG7788580.1 hypothetical protein KL910_003208 [Ogataea haglerorum]